MSKTKTLFTMALLVLLGSMGAVASAEPLLRGQAVYHPGGIGAREGGVKMSRPEASWLGFFCHGSSPASTAQ